MSQTQQQVTGQDGFYRSAALALAVGGFAAVSGGAKADIVAYTVDQALPATVYFNNTPQFTFGLGTPGNIVAVGTNLIAVTTGTATKLNAGDAINASLFTGASGTAPEFTVKTTPKYVALDVNAGVGVDYYGWAALVSTNGSSAVAPTDLVAYAFETTPNTAINAGDLPTVPEPASLALLAVGAAGVAAIRRKRRKVA